MKNAKRAAAALLAVLLAVLAVSLAGCGSMGTKEPTARELMEGVARLDDGKYNDMAVSMQMDGEAEGQSVSVTSDMGLEMCGSVLHMYDATIGMSMTGINFDMQVESWVDRGAGMMYMNATVLGQETGWFKAGLDGAADEPTTQIADAVASVRTVDAQVLDRLELEPHEEGQDYVVAWTADEADLAAMMDGILQSLTQGTESIDVDGMSFKATFDGETRELQSIGVLVAGSSDGADVRVEMTIAFLSVNGEASLAIPEDVETTAVEAAG